MYIEKMFHNPERTVVSYSNQDEPEWAFRAVDFSVLQIRITDFQMI